MNRRRTRQVATLLVALMAVLAGCGGAAQSGASGGGDGGAARSDAEFEERATSAPQSTELAVESSGSSDDASSTQSIDSRALIRTGHITLEVTDFERTEANLTELVDARGGFVSDTQQRQQRVGDRTYLTGTVVLRVPNERFAETFEDVQAEGEVIEASTSTEDVTEQLVDIEARLSNLRAQRDRLRTLYDQANDTQAVLQVERRLSEVQTEIERIEARKQSLERQVALSTVTVDIREERPDRLGVDEKWYDIGFVGAFLESVNGVVVALRAGVVLLGYVLPYLLVLATPVGLVGGLFAWRRGWWPFGSRAVADAPPAESTKPPSDADEAEDGDGGAYEREK
jgi:TolA-binding protein